MNLTVAVVMLTVIAASTAICAVQLLRLTGRMMKAADEVEAAAQRLAGLVPRLEKLADEASEELRELRVLTRRSDAVTADIQVISGQIRQGVALLDIPRKARAALVGARAGLVTLWRSNRHSNGKGDET